MKTTQQPTVAHKMLAVLTHDLTLMQRAHVFEIRQDSELAGRVDPFAVRIFESRFGAMTRRRLKLARWIREHPNHTTAEARKALKTLDIVAEFGGEMPKTTARILAHNKRCKRRFSKHQQESARMLAELKAAWELPAKDVAE